MSKELETLHLAPKQSSLWPFLLVGTFVLTLGLYLLYLPKPEITTQKAPVSQEKAPLKAPRPQLPWVIVSVDSDQSTYAQAFKEQLNQASPDSSMRYQLVTGGQWKGEKLGELSLLRLVEQGEIDMTMISTSPLSNVEPSFEVLDLPYLFESYQQADLALGGELGKALEKNLEQHGLMGLGFGDVGFRIISSSKEISSASDLKDKKIRVMQSAFFVRFATLLGSQPVPASVKKIKDLARKGYIDAAGRSFATYWDFGLYEVHPYILKTQHIFVAKIILINRDRYLELTPEQQTELRELAQRVVEQQRKLQRKEQEKVVELCQKQGIQISELSQEDKDFLRKKAQELRQEYRALRGGELLELIPWI